MIVALTGTPGTGKSAVAGLLEKEYGYRIVDVNRAARECGCVVGRDEERGTDIVDADALREALALTNDADGVVVLEGHLSHLLDAELVVVLRCHPAELGIRLQEKGFSPAKARENLEAESVDVALIEAVDVHGVDAVFEVDTTSLTLAETAEMVRALVEGDLNVCQTHRPGNVDWLAEGADWL